MTPPLLSLSFLSLNYRMNYAIRVTLPFTEFEDVVQRWADRCIAAIAYEHIADEEVSKTHVHLALYGCEVKAEALKRMWTNHPGKGNELWSWKDCSGILSVYRYTESVGRSELDQDQLKYMTYMSKGTLASVFLKYISPRIVDISRQLWVEPVKADKAGESSERIIKAIVIKIKEEFTYHVTDDDEDITPDYNERCLLTMVRTQTFKHLWAQKRMFPHGSHYKIVAGTVYMRLAEHYNCFDKAMKLISELWL